MAATRVVCAEKGVSGACIAVRTCACFAEPATAERVGLGKSTISQKVRRGEFPPPIRLTDHAIGWPVEDIDAWFAERDLAVPTTTRQQGERRGADDAAVSDNRTDCDRRAQTSATTVRRRAVARQYHIRLNPLMVA